MTETVSATRLFGARPMTRRSAFLYIGLVGITIAALMFHLVLDQSGTYLTRVYLERFYSGIVEKVFAERPWWYVLLPIPEFKGTWSTTGFVLLYKLERSIGPNATYLLVSSLATLAFGWAAWICSRSVAMALAAAAALAFSPFNYSVYLWNGSNNCYTLILFLSVALAAQFEVAFRGGGRVWRSVSVVALVLAAVSYEIWLNYAVYVAAIAPFLWLFARRHYVPHDVRRGVRFVVVSTLAVAVLYVLVRGRYLKDTLVVGLEAQLLTDYPTLGPAFDDAVYNLFFFFYLAVIQILPGVGGSSAAIYEGGRLHVPTLTRGYEPGLDFVVQAHFLYLWQFYAAVFFTLACLVAVHAWRRAVATGEQHWLIVFGLVLSVILGSPAHSMLKFVGFNAVPFYAYKVTVSLMMLYLLIGYLFGRVVERSSSLRLKRVLVLLFAVYLSVIAFQRPRWANENIAEIWGETGFFGNGFYPDPWKNLRRLVRGQR